MKILVTGGFGYIGSVLVPKLLNKEHTVTVLDSLLYDNGLTLMHSFKDKNFNFFLGDARDPRIIKDLVKQNDAVIHLAAIVGFPACKKDPKLAETTNVGATQLLSDNLSKDQPVFYASTGSNYGVIENEICTEETPLNPLSLYGVTKTKAEEILLSNNSCVAYRFATAFGISPRVRLDLLINDFVYQAVVNKSLVMFEKAFKRTFIHVDDMVDSFIFGLENFNKMNGEVYNIGGDINNYNKEEIAIMIKDHIDYYLHFAEIGEDEDKRNYEVSYKKINDAGFFIKKTVQEGIEELIKVVPALAYRNTYKNV